MRSIFLAVTAFFMLASMAQAELLRVEIKTLGMD